MLRCKRVIDLSTLYCTVLYLNSLIVTFFIYHFKSSLTGGNLVFALIFVVIFFIMLILSQSFSLQRRTIFPRLHPFAQIGLYVLLGSLILSLFFQMFTVLFQVPIERLRVVLLLLIMQLDHLLRSLDGLFCLCLHLICFLKRLLYFLVYLIIVCE